MSDTKKTILITDDEKDVLTYLSTLLEDNGFAVLTASNGQECLNIAFDKKPDLISLDVSMPEKSGVKALKELQESDITKNTPIIIVTGVDSRFKDFIHTRRQVHPPQGYIEKPVKPDDYIAKINELLNMSK